MRPTLFVRFVVFFLCLFALWLWHSHPLSWVLVLVLLTAFLVLLAGLMRYAGHRFWTRLRDQYTESPLERAMARELSRQGISFRREYQISNIHVDFALLDHKIAVECDGWKYHRDRREKDAARDAFLHRRGWRVMRFSGSRIRADVRGCVREIREAIENDSASFTARS